MKHDQIVAVESGGSAPPIVVPLTQEEAERRQTDRAYVDAGIMPLSDYLALYGREGQAQ